MRRFAKPVLISTLCAFASLVWAYSAGPPNGRTGAPGELTCAEGCHGNLNTGPGSITIVGPASYQPGDTIDLTVTAVHTGQSRWGFELTALDDSAQPTGTIIVTDALRTQVSTDGGTGRQYIKHTSTGTDAGVANISPGWTFKWASPAGPTGAVNFYAAGNAANNNGFSTGDFIYTDHIRYDENRLPTRSESWGGIKSLFAKPESR